MPVIKIPGSRNRLIPRLNLVLDSSATLFVDAFCGDLGYSLHLLRSNALKEYLVNDPNKYLINYYKVLSGPNDFQMVLDYVFSLGSMNYDLFSDLRRNVSNVSSTYNRIELAASFLLLKLTSFTRMMRWNKSGEFTSGFNQYFENVPVEKILTQIRIKNLKEESEALSKSNIRFSSSNFFNMFSADSIYFQNDLIGSTFYLNLPNTECHWPLVRDMDKKLRTSRWTAKPFQYNDHIAAMKIAGNLQARNARVIIPNSNTPFVKDLYTEVASSFGYLFDVHLPKKSDPTTDIIIVG